MSLLPTKKYSRLHPQEQSQVESYHSPSLIGVLEAEAYNLLGELKGIEEAKSREQSLRNRLNVVQQSLEAFRTLEAAPEQQLECLPEKRIRKAATTKTVNPTRRGIAPEPVVSDTENIALVHDDFATFPE